MKKFWLDLIGSLILTILYLGTMYMGIKYLLNFEEQRTIIFIGLFGLTGLYLVILTALIHGTRNKGRRKEPDYY